MSTPANEDSELPNGAEPQSKPVPQQVPVPESNPEPVAESQEQEPSKLEPQSLPEEEAPSQPEPVSSPVAETDADTKADDQLIQTNQVEKVESNGQNGQPELRKDGGSRTFTMRELLSELKSEEGEDVSTPQRFAYISLRNIYVTVLCIISH